MTVSTLPTPPTRAQAQDLFNDVADAFFSALPPMVTQINAVIAYLNLYQVGFLGAKSSPPTVNNSGGALVNGNVYFNNGDVKLYVWDGVAWVSFSYSDANLTAIANLTTSADKVPYYTGSGAADLMSFSTYMRSIMGTSSLSGLLSLLGLDQVQNTSDLTKPISNATQTALNGKLSASILSSYAPLNSPAFTGTVTGIAKSSVGLPNVDNTSDVNKPVSTLQAAAINAKQTTTAALTAVGSLTGVADNVPYFTSGTTAALFAFSSYMRGLMGSASAAALKISLSLDAVDNTSDANKPVSTATQTALNLKLNANFPVNTTLGGGTNAVYGIVSAALTSGFNNIFIGNNSGVAVQTGAQNTLVGVSAGAGITGGSNNTAIGVLSGGNINGGSNNTTIGAGSTTSTTIVSNEIVLGNSAITSLRCNVTTISALSDKRDKTEIRDCPVGLDFVNALRPVSYAWDRRDGTFKGRHDINFIAQDLDATQQDFDVEKYLNLVNKENPDRLEAAPGKLIPVLVKAIQELSAKVAALEAKI